MTCLQTTSFRWPFQDGRRLASKSAHPKQRVARSSPIFHTSGFLTFHGLLKTTYSNTAYRAHNVNFKLYIFAFSFFLVWTWRNYSSRRRYVCISQSWWILYYCIKVTIKTLRIINRFLLLVRRDVSSCVVMYLVCTVKFMGVYCELGCVPWSGVCTAKWGTYSVAGRTTAEQVHVPNRILREDKLFRIKFKVNLF